MNPIWDVRCAAGHHHVIAALVRMKGDVNQRLPDGYSPLHAAAQQGRWHGWLRSLAKVVQAAP
jgi:hypothetical protein